ncbi:MAG: hypothetical protein V3U16_09135 [Candidatus Neomarinimicrobiota bacterium]
MKLKNMNIIYSKVVLLAFVCLVACRAPLETNTTEDIVFSLSVAHNISRIVTEEPISLNWTEITLENFAHYKIERKTHLDTSWTTVATINNAFQLSYQDMIGDDEDLLYRVGIFDIEDNVRWAEQEITIPRTTSLSVPDEIDKIQSAISNSLIDDGDSILVKPGQYPETLTIAGKDILVKSLQGFEVTTLLPTPASIPDSAMRVVNVSSGILEGFRIRQGYPSYSKSGGGAYVGGNGVIKNCFITENQTDGFGGGIFLTAQGKLLNNIIHINESPMGQGSGIYINNAHGEIVNNTITGNDVVLLGDCEGLVFRNNIVYGYGTDISFSTEASQSGVEIEYSLLEHSSNIGQNNITGDPEFVGLEDFHLLLNSPCIDAGHPGEQYLDADGTRNDMGAYGGPYGQ